MTTRATTPTLETPLLCGPASALAELGSIAYPTRSRNLVQDLVAIRGQTRLTSLRRADAPPGEDGRPADGLPYR
jgi:hypothetical protein